LHEFVHTARRLFAGRKFQDAAKVCRLGLLKDPSCLEGRIVLGQSLLSLARYDEVVAEARAALEIQESSSEATVLLGEALFFKGAFGQAREVLGRAAQLDPENKRVARLLQELDATAEAGLDLEDEGSLGDETRSYPTAEEDLAAIGDETEVQETPPDMMEPPLATPGKAPGPPEDEASQTPAEQAAQGGSPFLVTEVPDDEDRPDPIAGEVQVEPSLVPRVEAPTETVDLSGANLLPEPEPRYHDEEDLPPARGGEPPKGPASGQDSETDTSIEVPLGGRQTSPAPSTSRRGSHSGRRWSDRKWLQSEEISTREAVVVPSPQLTTQEMESSDLFGRGSSPKEAPTQLLKKGSGEAAVQAGQARSEPMRGDGGSEPSPAPVRKVQGGAPKMHEAPPASTPGFDDEDAETASLKRPASTSALKRPLGQGAPPSRPPPGLQEPGKPPVAPPPPLEPPRAPRVSAGLASAPSGPHKNPFALVPGEISGVEFEPPPAAPPPGVRPLGPLPSPDQPGSSPGAPPGASGRATLTLAGSPGRAAPARSIPDAARGHALPHRQTPGAARPASSDARPVPQRGARPVAARAETTARTRKPWRWWLRRHKVAVFTGGAIGGILVALVLALLLRPTRDQEQSRRLALQARAALRKATFPALVRADRLLLHCIRQEKSNQAARSLRLLVASLLAVEHGVAVDRTQDLVQQAGHPTDAPGQAGAALAALAAVKPARAQRLARQATRTHPSSPWLAYARATIQTWLGHADVALTRLAGVEQGDAHLFLTRARVRAMLAQGQAEEALGVLDSLKPAVQRAAWATVLRARVELARSQGPLSRATQDALVGMLALSQEAVGQHQRRWAHLLLAEAYDRLGKEPLRSKHASAALSAQTEATPPSLQESLALHLVHHGQPARGLQIARQVQERYPDRATAVAVLAEAALALSDAAQARRAVEALAVQRRTVEVKLLHIRALLALGKREKAESELRALRRAQPESSAVRLAWARLMAKRGHLSDALQEVEALLRKHPRFVEAIALAAQIERSMGKMTDAAMRFEAAVRLRPRNPALRAELVTALIASGNIRSAANTLDAAEAAFLATRSSWRRGRACCWSRGAWWRQ